MVMNRIASILPLHLLFLVKISTAISSAKQATMNATNTNAITTATIPPAA